MVDRWDVLPHNSFLVEKKKSASIKLFTVSKCNEYDSGILELMTHQSVVNFEVVCDLVCRMLGYVADEALNKSASAHLVHRWVGLSFDLPLSVLFYYLD
jgi:hypothetical protein